MLRRILPLAIMATTFAADIDPRIVILAHKVIEKYDINRSKSLESREQKLLVTRAEKEYCKGVALTLERVLLQADGNKDGEISHSEWSNTVSWAQSNSQNPTRRSTSQLRMADGAHLATDVHLPRGKGRWPTILLRTPYSRKRKGEPYTLRSYACIMQDMRGRFDSSGENYPFIGCGWTPYRDGLATVEWIRRQPWSNGKIGTTGGSALGITQYLMAPLQPMVTAQYIAVGAPCLYRYAAYVGGAFRKSQVEGWMKSNKYSWKALEDMCAHPNFDAHWERFDSLSRVDKVNLPAVHIGGWFDTFAQGTIDAFAARQYRGGKGARGTQKLVMGPWVHALDGKDRAGALKFPNSNRPKAYSDDSWFAYWLHGARNGVDRLPAVAYYVMGDVETPGAPGNEWRYANDWPIGAEEQIHYLAQSTLTQSKPTSDSSRTIRFDPRSPCPTKGGGNLCLPNGSFDQRPVESRPDVLTFTTLILQEPVETTGRVKAVLYVSSSAVDTDLSVRLTDVYPDGRSFLMAEGMLRLRHRNTIRKSELLVPKKIYKVVVSCWATSIIFNKRHRIRVAVTSSNYPRFDVNPGTGKPWKDGEPTVIQSNRIHTSNDHPSHVILPVPL